MPTDVIRFTLNGRPVTAATGSTVAAAVMANSIMAFRKSVTGEDRAPLCGMGICFECRLTIDGQSQQKSCQIVLTEGMAVKTDE